MNDKQEYIARLGQLQSEISDIDNQLILFSKKLVTIKFKVEGTLVFKDYDTKIIVEDHLTEREKQAYIDMILTDIGSRLIDKKTRLEIEQNQIIKYLNK